MRVFLTWIFAVFSKYRNFLLFRVFCLGGQELPELCDKLKETCFMCRFISGIIVLCSVHESSSFFQLLTLCSRWFAACQTCSFYALASNSVELKNHFKKNSLFRLWIPVSFMVWYPVQFRIQCNFLYFHWLTCHVTWEQQRIQSVSV